MRSEKLKKRLRCSDLLWPVLLVLVSACSNGPSLKPESHHEPGSAITAMKLTVGGKEINNLVESRNSLENGIEDFAINSGNHGDNLKALIDELRASNLDDMKSAPGFTGISGILGHETLNIAEEALNPANGHYEPGKRVVVTMEGKIIDYKFDGNVNNPGNGKLTVITAVTSRVVSSGGGNPPPRITGFKWEIVVNDNGFKVVKHSNNDNDPFPNTMDFSPAMLNRVKSLGFQYKLWAKGTKIKVNKVWRKQNFKWTEIDRQNYWGQPLPDVGNVPWKRLYKTDSESCIDMMFVNVPPATFDQLGEPPWYCLGRCTQPSIVNSR